MLLEEAGVQPDVRLRGTAGESVCPSCGYTEPLLCLVDMLPEPHCPACGALMRPGTPPDPGAAQEAERLVRAADVVLLAGVGADHPLARLAARTEELRAG